MKRLFRLAVALWAILQLAACNGPDEIIEEVNKLNDSSQIVDFLASNFVVNIDERKDLLEEYDATKRIKRLCEIFKKDIEIFNLDSDIQQKVKYNLTKQQRDMYLREQIMNFIKKLQ